MILTEFDIIMLNEIKREENERELKSKEDK